MRILDLQYMTNISSAFLGVLALQGMGPQLEELVVDGSHSLEEYMAVASENMDGDEIHKQICAEFREYG